MEGAVTRPDLGPAGSRSGQEWTHARTHCIWSSVSMMLLNLVAWETNKHMSQNCLQPVDSEANIIKKKDKLLGRFIPYFTRKIWNKNTQYVVLKKHDILGIFIPYFTRKIWNKTTQ